MREWDQLLNDELGREICRFSYRHDPATPRREHGEYELGSEVVKKASPILVDIGEKTDMVRLIKVRMALQRR